VAETAKTSQRRRKAETGAVAPKAQLSGKAQPSGKAQRAGHVRAAQSDRRRESMTLILDHAEALFAELGYNGATLKDVADDAGVDPALMRYYFGDKQQLFKAVFVRRAPEINMLRQAAMARYRAIAGDNMQLEGIIEAFMRPSFEKMAGDQGWRNYMAIVSYVNASRGFLHTLMSETFDHISHELIADFRKLYPDAEEAEYYWAYHLIIGSYTFSLGRTGRVDALSKGLCSSSDVLAICDRLPGFLAAGVRQLLTR
jgi:AcrR family transcriptional regulator